MRGILPMLPLLFVVIAFIGFGVGYFKEVVKHSCFQDPDSTGLAWRKMGQLFHLASFFAFSWLVRSLRRDAQKGPKAQRRARLNSANKAVMVCGMLYIMADVGLIVLAKMPYYQCQDKGAFEEVFVREMARTLPVYIFNDIIVLFATFHCRDISVDIFFWMTLAVFLEFMLDVVAVGEVDVDNSIFTYFDLKLALYMWDIATDFEYRQLFFPKHDDEEEEYGERPPQRDEANETDNTTATTNDAIFMRPSERHFLQALFGFYMLSHLTLTVYYSVPYGQKWDGHQDQDAWRLVWWLSVFAQEATTFVLLLHCVFRYFGLSLFKWVASSCCCACLPDQPDRTPLQEVRIANT